MLNNFCKSGWRLQSAFQPSVREAVSAPVTQVEQTKETRKERKERTAVDI